MTRFDHAISGTAAPPVQWRYLLALLFLWTAVQAVFFPTAFRIDEPNIIALAGQIAREPLDPYGFTINWNGTEESAFTTLANPPLVPAWLALWASLFGWSETSLHLAMLPFSWIALAAIVSIARDLGIASPLIAAAALACSPAFFLAAQVVMPDIAMVAFLGASVALCFRFLATGGTWTLALASVCAALTPLTKYNGVVLTVVLAGLWLVFAQRRRPLAIVVIASLAGLASWSLIGIATYGEPHFLASSRLQGGAAVNALTGSLIGLGLGALPLALAFRTAPPAAAARVWRLLLPLVALVLAMLAAFSLDYPVVPALLFSAGGTIAIHFLVTVVWKSFESRGGGPPLDAILVAWILVTLVLQFQLLFTSVRYLLPLVIPAILLTFRLTNANAKILSALAVNAVFVVALGIGDARTANLYRDFVSREVEPRRSPGGGTLYYDGHWGLQHYASRLGGIAVDRRTPPEIREGDLLVSARNAFPVNTRTGAQVVTTFEADPGWPLRTIDCEGAANFHGNAIGGCRYFPVYLPFAFGVGAVETFTLAQIGQGTSVIAGRNF